MMQNPQLFDVVELLVNLPEHGLQVGAQGAIVEQYSDQSYEVEFTNGIGETITMVVLSPEQFVVVWRSEAKTEDLVPAGAVCEVWSPYDAFDAAKTMMQALKDGDE
jgi:hypothetical protein